MITDHISPESAQNTAAVPARGFSRVVACIGTGEPLSRVIQHAIAMANSLAVPLLLLRVFVTRPTGEERQDPLDWEIRRREAYGRVEVLVEQYRHLCGVIDAEVVEGQAAEQISLWAQRHPNELTVLGTHGEWRPEGWGLGDTAREVVDHAPGSLLLIPCSAPNMPKTGYRRLLVPLDGSCRAESVLPFAMHLAKAQHAELLLVHVVPPTALTEVGPAESEDVELCERLLRRNQRVAQQYLARLQSRATEHGLMVRASVLCEDVRSSLMRISAQEGVDLIVLSAHGCSGRLDMPYGSVTSFLMTHIRQPLLVMRQQPPFNAFEDDGGGQLEMRFALQRVR
ncbi:universal stress protein [Pseudomonas sp.]|uniref:universal stress protein n=1 Tax=Pseudomonas sp. TaxID=306 RepID=UPI00299E3E48|nr:universal stress protein [Pseudomonas sp.]MDX1366648.1 universal stress protein [Pseudomonas sp.]